MRKIQVCLIDDEKNIADLFFYIVKKEFKESINLDVFYFSEDLLDFSKNNHIDLLICDIDMPVKDGISLASEIRKANENPEILFLTGMNNFENAYKALQIENVSYILKLDADEKLISVIKAKIESINSRNKMSDDIESIEKENYSLQDALISDMLYKLLKGENVKGETFDPSLMFLLNIASGNVIANNKRKEIAKLIKSELNIKVGELIEVDSGKFVFLKPHKEEGLDERLNEVCKKVVELTNNYVLCVYKSSLVSSNEFMLTYDNLSQYVSRVADSSKMVHVECLTSANEVMNLINEDNKLLDEIKKYIWDNMETDVSLNSIASYLHYNPSYLSRLFKQKYDCNIKDFILNTKLKKGESLLVNNDLFVKEIAQKLGFDSISHFFRLFKNVYGVSPNEYRAKYQTKIKK